VLAGPWARNELWRRARAMPSLDLRFAESKSLVDAVSGQNLITFTRASTGTFVDSDGVIRSAGNDVPRFDHNPLTGECLGLLVEEQRQNLLLRSEEFDNASWTKGNSSVSADATQAPTGTTTADKLVENTATTEHNITQSATWLGNTTYTFSVYAKPDGRSRFDLLFGTAGNWSGGRQAAFDVSTGSVVATDGAMASITAAGDGWFRCRITATTTASPSASLVALRMIASGTSVTYTGDGTSGLFLWGAQLEAGAFPTSYIPTTGTAATRTADVVSISGIDLSSWYNQSTGSIFCEALNKGLLGTAAPRPVSFSNGTNNNLVEFFGSTDTSIGWQVLDGGVTQANVAQSASSSTINKLAATYALNNFALSINAAASSTDTSGTIPVIDRVRIGNRQDSARSWNGPIRRLTYWPTRLPNSTLQSITL
jgi:hypothetical protein